MSDELGTYVRSAMSSFPLNFQRTLSVFNKKKQFESYLNTFCSEASPALTFLAIFPPPCLYEVCD